MLGAEVLIDCLEKEKVGAIFGYPGGQALDIFDDTPANPRVEFKKLSSCDMLKLTLHEAILEIEKSRQQFLPFFNVESEFINIISKNGNRYEVMVPAF